MSHNDVQTKRKFSDKEMWGIHKTSKENAVFVLMKKCFIKLINDKRKKVKKEEEIKEERSSSSVLARRRKNNKSAEGENWKLLKLTSAGGKDR